MQVMFWVQSLNKENYLNPISYGVLLAIVVIYFKRALSTRE